MNGVKAGFRVFFYWFKKIAQISIFLSCSACGACLNFLRRTRRYLLKNRKNGANSEEVFSISVDRESALMFIKNGLFVDKVYKAVFGTVLHLSDGFSYLSERKTGWFCVFCFGGTTFALSFIGLIFVFLRPYCFVLPQFVCIVVLYLHDFFAFLLSTCRLTAPYACGAVSLYVGLFTVCAQTNYVLF